MTMTMTMTKLLIILHSGTGGSLQMVGASDR